MTGVVLSNGCVSDECCNPNASVPSVSCNAPLPAKHVFFVLAFTTVAAVAKDPCSLTVASPRLVDAAAVAAAANAAVRPVSDQPPVLGAGGRRGSRAKRGRGVRARSFCVEPGACTNLNDTCIHIAIPSMQSNEARSALA